MEIPGHVVHHVRHRLNVRDTQFNFPSFFSAILHSIDKQICFWWRNKMKKKSTVYSTAEKLSEKNFVFLIAAGKFCEATNWDINVGDSDDFNLHQIEDENILLLFFRTFIKKLNSTK